jgi:hypothetical protein
VRRALVLLAAGVALSLSGCDRGGAEQELPRLSRPPGDSGQSAFLNLGKRSASDGLELR